MFHWPHLPGLPIGIGEYEADAADPGRDLLGARSYLVESEKEQVRSLLGPVQEQVMLLRPGCAPELAQEAARHKIVDFIGDMMVLGRRLTGRYVAVRAGHRIHHLFLQHLANNDLLG